MGFIHNFVHMRRRHRAVVGASKDVPQWVAVPTDGLIFDQFAGDDTEDARGVAVVVEGSPALRRPANQPYVVGSRALHARERSLERCRFRKGIEARGVGVVVGERREEPGRQRWRNELGRTAFRDHACLSLDDHEQPTGRPPTGSGGNLRQAGRRSHRGMTACTLNA